jgi:hypothetical protein
MVIREGKTPGDDGDTPTSAIPLGDNISFKDGFPISTSLRLQAEINKNRSNSGLNRNNKGFEPATKTAGKDSRGRGPPQKRRVKVQVHKKTNIEFRTRNIEL